jgi:DNA-binding MarR family transcriptional regulator
MRHSSALLRMDPKLPPLDFDLETTLPYLLNRAGVRIGLTFSGEIGRHDLALPEWRILASLLGREWQSVSELAEHTSAELSRVSRLVSGLERRALLRRKASGVDARAVELALTAKGRALALQIVPLAQLYERVALAGMSADEVDLLKALLRKVYDNMDALNASGRRVRRTRTREARA